LQRKESKTLYNATHQWLQRKKSKTLQEAINQCLLKKQCKKLQNAIRQWLQINGEQLLPEGNACFVSQV
jgi:hypothetical protein